MKTSISKEAKIIILVFLAALSIRLVYLHSLSASPLFSSPAMDAAVHDTWAFALVNSPEDISNAPYFRAPLYPYFLSLFYRVANRSFSTYLMMRLAQFLLGSISCLLIYILARRLYGVRAGLLAAGIAILYWPFIYFEGELLIPALLISLTLIGFLFLHEAITARCRVAFFLSGLCFGLAAITRPNILLFFPILAAWIILDPTVKDRSQWNRLLKNTAIFLCGIIICILPITLRNYVVGKDLVLISSQAGVNFYIGNNEYSDGKTAIVPGTRATWWGGYLDCVRIAETEIGRSLRPSEVSRYWFRRALRFITQNPGLVLRQYFKKTQYFFNNIEISNNQNIYFFRNYTGVINFPLFIGFTLLAPFGLAGIIFLRRDRYWWLMSSFILTYFISIILFFVAGRYRLAIIPFLIIFAAAFIIELSGYIARKELKPVPLRIGTVVFLFIVLRIISLPFPLADIDGVSDGHYSLANAYMRLGKSDRAYPLYKRTVQLKEPYRSRSYVSLGMIELESGDTENATRNLAEAVKLNPMLCGEVMQTLAGDGRGDLLESVFDVQAMSPSEKIQYYMKLGDLSLKKGDYAGAERYYEKVITTDKSVNAAFVNLGNLYSLKQDGQKKAMEIYLHGLTYHPKNLILNYNLADVYLQLNHKEKALEIIRTRLLSQEPDNPAFLSLLHRARAP